MVTPYTYAQGEARDFNDARQMKLCHGMDNDEKKTGNRNDGPMIKHHK